MSSHRDRAAPIIGVGDGKPKGALTEPGQEELRSTVAALLYRRLFSGPLAIGDRVPKIAAVDVVGPYRLPVTMLRAKLMEIADHNPQTMGKSKACYSTLFRITSIYARLA